MYLTEIVRQSDPVFMDLLNEVRLGKCSPQTSAVLAACHVSIKQIPNDNILPTKLYCTNANVDEENMARLRALPGQQYDLVAIDSWQSEPSNSDQRQQVRYAVPYPNPNPYFYCTLKDKKSHILPVVNLPSGQPT